MADDGVLVRRRKSDQQLPGHWDWEGERKAGRLIVVRQREMSERVFPDQKAYPLASHKDVDALRLIETGAAWVHGEIRLIPQEPIHVKDLTAGHGGDLCDVRSQTREKADKRRECLENSRTQA